MRLFVFLVAAIAAFLPVQAFARTIDFGDLRKIVSLNSPQISPDGKRVVFIRSRADFDKDKNVSQLMLVDVRTKQLRELTYDERTGISSPQWSPDGRRIAFLANSKHDEKSEEQPQIFVLSLDGGDARKVSDVPSGVDGFAWSPDGKRFAFVTQDENPHKKQIDEHLDAFEVGSNDYLHKSEAMPSHLWVMNSSGGKARRLTAGSWSLGTVDPYGTSNLSWSADGKKITYVHFPTPLVGDSLGTVIDVVDVQRGKRVQLNPHSNMEGWPEFAPAGSAISYTRNTAGDAGNGTSVYVKEFGSADPPSRADVDRNIDGKAWAAGGKALWLFGRNALRTAAWYAPLGHAARPVALGNVALSETSNVARTGEVAFVGTTASHPAELYYLASPSSRPVRLTNENSAAAHLELGRVVPVTWRNDGFAEDGVLTLPPHYDPHKSYPLVLVIHGGPQSASTIGWSSQNQLFAARGYMVFNPNYRGSTNLGDRYQHAIVRDTGDGPGRDVMAGIAAVERSYKVDKSRVAVSGWSYGGYMTSWMIGHYNIWKTAVSGAALNDWFDDYNDAFYVYTDVPFFGGSPWNPKYTAMWRAQSPITYAQNVRTPTLILGDLGDNNVTITNSFKMYHALKDNGVPVEFVAYPVHGHHPSDPVRSEDVTRRWLAWIDRYLR